LDLGLQLIEKSGELLFITDHLPPENETPEKMTCISVGRKLDNVALSAARWTFDSAAGKGQVFVRVQNHSRKSMNFELTGRSGQNVLFRRSGTLPEQGGQAVEVEVPGGRRQMTVELAAPDDGLAIDNRVELFEPQVRTVTAAIDTPQADAANAILRVLDALPDVQLGETASANLVFAPAGTLPESNPRRWWAGFGPISRDDADVKAAKDIAGPYLLDKREKLLEGVVLGGVVWGGVQPLPYDATPLVSSGNLILLARLSGTRTIGYLFNIDLSRSNLAESPDWPILITNLVELRRDALPGLTRWNYRLGEDVRFRLFEGEGEASAAEGALALEHDGRKKKSVAKTSLVELSALDLDETGVYEVKEGEKSVGRFAVNLFDAEESDLRNLVPGRRDAKSATATGSIALDNPYSWLILAALLLILVAVFADWFVLKRP
jgi:Ca-activated chloride channel homolog